MSHELREIKKDYEVGSSSYPPYISLTSEQVEWLISQAEKAERLISMKEVIKSQILDHAEEIKMELTEEELRNAMAGVEYCVSLTMADSVQDALSNVELDRERRV